MIEYENLAKANKRFFSEYKVFFNSFLKKGWFILGDQVREFENRFASYCSTQYCVGVASGLDALILALNAFGFSNGSEILVASNTYIATIIAIVRNGLKPVLVEPDIRTYNIDPQKIEEKITKNTKAILVTHLYGKPCYMDQILEIGKEYHLEIIEDCAQAHGAMYKGKMVGSFGIGCFSFYPTKNLGCVGDGGAITCNEVQYKNKLVALRNYGSFRKYENEYIGYNSRLDELQAGFLSIKLQYINDIIAHKRTLAKIYHNNLDERYIKPIVDNDLYDVYHIFNIRHKKRDNLKEYLLKNGIKTEIHYPIPPHKQKAMLGIIEGDYPISEEIHNTTLSLPISIFHTVDDIYRICEVMNKWNQL